MEIDDLLRFMVRQEASDLHIKPMRPPLVRIKGRLRPLESDALSPDVIKEMLYKVLSERQRATLEESLSLDFAYSLKGVSRFRGAVYFQRGTLAAVFRRIPFEFPTLDEWGLPDVLKKFARLPQGLVVFAGPAGAGKSSTLAAMAREVLQDQLVHVVTIEDPIEFLLSDSLGTVSQREVGVDTHTFGDALRGALRQDPDVIVVGEMLGPETISTVITAAETGHLVLSTVHATSSAQVIERIVEAFPEGQHRAIRSKLALVLEAVVVLQLVDRADGSGLVAAVEIMDRSPKIAKLIADGGMNEMNEEIERSVAFEGMQSMNQSLAALVLNGVVSPETALARSSDPSDLDLQLRRSLQPGGLDAREEDSDMADSPADFSKILRLRETERLYEELQDRYRQEVSDRDALIASLRADLATKETASSEAASLPRALVEERDRLAHQLSFQKQEYESKIEKLQLRIRELTAPVPEPARSGFFRR